MLYLMLKCKCNYICGASYTLECFYDNILKNYDMLVRKAKEAGWTENPNWACPYHTKKEISMQPASTTPNPFPGKTNEAPEVPAMGMSCSKCGAPISGAIMGSNGRHYCSTDCLAATEGLAPSNGPLEYNNTGAK